MEKEVIGHQMCIRRSIHRCIPAAVVCLLAGSALTLSAVMVRLPLSSLVGRADVITTGCVESKHCEWSLDRRLIVTVVDIRVREIWKGDMLPSVIQIQVPGGTIGDLTLRVSDTPSFHVGEDVCLFLESAEKVEPALRSLTVVSRLFSSFTVAGQAQGNYRFPLTFGEGQAGRQ